MRLAPSWPVGYLECGFPIQFHDKRHTTVRFIEHAARLHEQEPGRAFASSLLGLYAKRWLRWAESGLRRDAKAQMLRDTGVVRAFTAPPMQHAVT